MVITFSVNLSPFTLYFVLIGMTAQNNTKAMCESILLNMNMPLMHAGSCTDAIIRSFNNVVIAKVIELLLKMLGEINTCAIFETMYNVSVLFN